MNDVREVLKKYNITPLGYFKINDDVIKIKAKDKTYVLKKVKHSNKDIYNILNVRGFKYAPSIHNLDSDDKYYIEDYYEDSDMIPYDKALDIINLTSLLHNKTTIVNNVSIDDYKKIYEDTLDKINEMVTYYNELNNYIDTEIYMSPSSYLLVRNISKIYASLDFCKKELDNWESLVKTLTKQRNVLINNNLELNHLLKNDRESVLLSWDKAKYDMPIYDIYNFYKKIYKTTDFDSLFNVYLSRYPLTKEELKLFFVIISLPWKIDDNNDSEYDRQVKVLELLIYLDKTEKIVSKYYTDNEKE